jgi:hypothetical protein
MSRKTDGSGEIVPGNAAGEQQLVDEVVGLEVHVGCVRRSGPPAPRLAEDRAGHAADKARAGQHK